MNEEQAKEITITMINKGVIYTGGEDNEEIAKKIAKFYNTLLEETNVRRNNLMPNQTPEEILADIPDYDD